MWLYFLFLKRVMLKGPGLLFNYIQLCSNIDRLCKYAIYIFVYILYVSTCASAFCPIKCSCNDQTLRVECKNVSLELIPFLLNPETRLLLLRRNVIDSIGQSLAFYPELIEIDLSYNRIQFLTSEDFEMQSKLVILNLSENKIKTIPNLAFSKLLNLKKLYLQHNLIDDIQLQAFDNCFELRVLDVSDNRLNKLNASLFKDLIRLEILKMKNNNFSYVPSNVLNAIVSLKLLDISGNYISSIPPRAFQNMVNMTSLYVDRNNISVVFSDSFEGLAELRRLSIKDNRLSFISGREFKPIKLLHSLDISGNLFEKLMVPSFNSLTNLNYLGISRCPYLHYIDPETFANLQSLKTLKLSHNARLVYLEGNIFSSLSELRHLDLTACGIVSIHPEQLPDTTSLELHVAGNPLNCNCSLLWLATFPFNDSDFGIPTCATPTSLYGVYVTKLNSEIADCSAKVDMTIFGTIIGIALLWLLVSAFVLVCRWYRKSTSNVENLHAFRDRRETELSNSTLSSQDHWSNKNAAAVPSPNYCFHVPQTVSSPRCTPIGVQYFHPTLQSTRPLIPATPPLRSHINCSAKYSSPSSIQDGDQSELYMANNYDHCILHRFQEAESSSPYYLEENPKLLNAFPIPKHLHPVHESRNSPTDYQVGNSSSLSCTHPQHHTHARPLPTVMDERDASTFRAGNQYRGKPA